MLVMTQHFNMSYKKMLPAITYCSEHLNLNITVLHLLASINDHVELLIT